MALAFVATKMETAIRNADYANSYFAKIKSVLPTTSTVLTCGAGLLYTAAVLTGLYPPVLI